ncbi:MAG: serine/threonine protein kinase [Clostridia bacterium]|nr:serine/threonine protein kinase [Clostridia bacterium]
MIRCLRCFEEYPDIYEVCPVCGNSVGCLSAPEGWLKPGCLLDGRFIIGTGAGRGGFGYVYRAYDRLTGDITAIKELFLPSLVKRADDGISVEPIPSRTSGTEKNNAAFLSLKKKFRHEATSAAGASAFGGCDVIDFFEANGTAYLAMEYIGGRTLAGIIAETKADIGDKTELMLAIIKTVGDMHSSGTVHLDIAPDNIIVSEGDGIRTVHLIDFGSSVSDRDYHPAGDKIFKAGYSAPELTSGRLGGVKRMKQAVLCDIYSLGATAYALLTGTPPVRAEKRLQGKEILPYPSETVPEIPAEVSDSIMKAMEPSPEKRFATAFEFYSSLISAAVGAGIKGVLPLMLPENTQKVRFGRHSPFLPMKEKISEKEPEDRTLATGVYVPVPEQLLPGTELKKRYTIGRRYYREGVCLVYELDDLKLGRPVEICEFFPRKLCRRSADGVTVEPLSDYYADALAMFRDCALRFAAYREYPGGDGITDVFCENNTVYLRRRSGHKLSMADRSNIGNTESFEVSVAALKDVLEYLTALHAGGLVQGSVSPFSLRQTDGGKISLFSPASLFWPEQFSRYGNYEKGYSAPELCLPSGALKRTATP